METQIKEAIESVQRTFVEYKEANDARIAQIKASGEAAAETVAKVIAMEKAMEKQEDLAARLEQVELAAKRRVSLEGDIDQLPSDEKNHLEKFSLFMRNPKDPVAQREYEEATRSLKQVEITTPGLGGYAVPRVLVQTIEKKVIEVSPMRSIVNVQKASSTDFNLLVDTGGASSGWVGEKQTRTETDTPGLEPVKPTFGMLYAYPKATEESMTDMFFDVANWLADSVSEAFAYQEGRAILTGNGVNKPTGMLFPAPEAAGDYATGPARTFGHFQFLKTNDAAGFPAGATQADPIIDLIFAVAAPYRQNARFLMNRFSMATIRKFKDADGNYIWTPGLTAAGGSTLMGFPITEAEGVDPITANMFPVGFGDFKKGYLLADLVGLRVTPDEITTPGFVKWYFRKRMGGIVFNDDAVKWLKVAA
jgi:HK97 family phage major capsid protein